MRAYILHGSGAGPFLTESVTLRADGRILYRSRWRQPWRDPGGKITLLVEGVRLSVVLA